MKYITLIRSLVSLMIVILFIVHLFIGLKLYYQCSSGFYHCRFEIEPKYDEIRADIKAREDKKDKKDEI